MLPVLEGIIARRILLNFRVDPDIVQPLIPPPLEVEHYSGFAIVGVCLIRLEQLRPKGMPSVLGVSSENMAHRIAIRYPGEDGMKPGVFIWRRETDQKMVELFGGRLFPGVHGGAKFVVGDAPDRLQMSVTTPGKEADVTFAARRRRGWQSGSVFASVNQASEFFQKGDCGFSCSLQGDRVEGLRLKMLRWEMEPLDIKAQHCSFYNNPSRFPESSVTFDSALLIRGLPHEWHEIKDIPELAVA